VTTEEQEEPSEALRAAADPDEPILSSSPVVNLTPPAGTAKAGRVRGVALLANLALLPPTLIAALAGGLLGPVRGALVALLASLVIAVAGYATGHAIGPETLRHWISRRSYRSARQLGAQGLSGVIVLRLASVASAGAVHLLCGAVRLPFATFMLGTAIGLAPTTFAVAGLGALLDRVVQDPSLLNAVTVLVVAALLLAAIAAIRTVLLIRRFAPSVRGHRTRAEFG
jgi:uncharacterized membrane protein YdjX (TVP38/TMEM64 family)